MCVHFSCVDSCCGCRFHIIQGIHRRAAAGGRAAGIAGDFLIGNQGDIVHADPTLGDAAPFGGTDGGGFQNLHLGAGQQLGDGGVAYAGAGPDIHAGVGVGHNAGAGDGSRRGSAAGGIRAFIDLQILAVDPAVVVIVVDAVLVGVHLVPVGFLVDLPDRHGDAPGQRADNIAGGYGAVVPNPDAVRVHHGSNQTCRMGSGNARRVNPADIQGGQVDPAGITFLSQGVYRPIRVFDILILINMAPDIFAYQLNLIDFKFHAGAHDKYRIRAAVIVYSHGGVADGGKPGSVHV